MTPPWLFGIWRLLRADPSLDFAPGVRMEFCDGGQLLYHVDIGGRDQVLPLLYRIEDDFLHTENPSAPHAMAVRFSHGVGDVLMLDFAGAQAAFVRD